MRRLKCTLLVALAVFCLGLLSINVHAAEVNPAESRSDAAPDDWEFVLELYGWLPDIKSTTARGDDLEIDLDTILDNLDFVFFTTAGARKNRWQIMIDIIYLKMSDDPNADLNRLFQLNDIEMKAWIINPFVSYEIFGSRKGSFQLMAGARYLDLEVDLGLTTRPPLPPRFTKETASADVWDGVVGIRGFYNLTDRWFVPYRADIGTGDSDFTWQALTGIGYKFESFKLIGAYRHLEWEFEDDAPLQDMQVSGPVIGAVFVF